MKSFLQISFLFVIVIFNLITSPSNGATIRSNEGKVEDSANVNRTDDNPSVKPADDDDKNSTSDVDNKPEPSTDIDSTTVENVTNSEEVKNTTTNNDTMTTMPVNDTDIQNNGTSNTNPDYKPTYPIIYPGTGMLWPMPGYYYPPVLSFDYFNRQQSGNYKEVLVEEIEETIINRKTRRILKDSYADSVSATSYTTF